MPVANIEINGTASSKDTLPINTLVQLSNADVGGEVTYLWEILDQPVGTADVLSNAAIENPTFTPKKEGSYFLRLTVNAALGSISINTKIAAVRELKTNERIDAAFETTEVDAAKGWKTATNAAMKRALNAVADANLVACINAPSSFPVIGNIVKFSIQGTIKTGLPGQEGLPVVEVAKATSFKDTHQALGVVVGTPSGSGVAANSVVIVQRFGLVALAQAGSPVVGDAVYLGNTSLPSLVPGSVTRVIGRVTASAAGSWTWVIDGTNTVGILPLLADQRNFIRNGGFWFAQRQAPTSQTTYSALTGRLIAGADGWAESNENASMDFARVDVQNVAPETGLLASNYGTFRKITSTGKLVISQVIEGREMEVLRGRTVRLQMKLKQVVNNQTVRIGLAQLAAAGTVDTIPATFISAFGANGTDPTLGTNLAYITPNAAITEDLATVSGSAASCAVTAVWQKFGATFLVPIDCKNLVVLIWSNNQLAALDGFSISEALMTNDSASQGWTPADLTTELHKVQRFYSKSFSVDTVPAIAGGLPGAIRGYVSVAGAATGEPIGVRYPVEMRSATPTMNFFNPSAGNGQVRNTVANTDGTATAGANPATSGTDIQCTGAAGWTVAQALAVHYTADCEL